VRAAWHGSPSDASKGRLGKNEGAPTASRGVGCKRGLGATSLNAKIREVSTGPIADPDPNGPMGTRTELLDD
jgi:hypothetical protein